MRFRGFAPGIAIALVMAGTPGSLSAQVTHVVANSWQSTDFQNPDNPGCSIGADGSIPGGQLIMGASQRRPAPMSLVIRKTGWVIPAGTRVSVRATFPDGWVTEFAGIGKGQAIEIDLDGNQLKDWVHSLTANLNMQLTFSGIEPPWQFDLTGTTKVVDAMGDCFAVHQIKGVGPPFSGAFSANAGQAVPGTQPFSAPTQAPAPLIIPTLENLSQLPNTEYRLLKRKLERSKGQATSSPTSISSKLDSIENDLKELQRVND
jgi:hypothetical protein